MGDDGARLCALALDGVGGGEGGEEGEGGTVGAVDEEREDRDGANDEESEEGGGITPLLATLLSSMRRIFSTRMIMPPSSTVGRRAPETSAFSPTYPLRSTVSLESRMNRVLSISSRCVPSM
jgi:hypothetical protein